jgi:hypothetical protein
MATVEPAFGTYEYVAHGSLGRGPIRQRMARFEKPWLWAAYVVFWLAFGLVSALVTYSTSLPYYPRRVIEIGVLWGLEFLAAASLAIGLMLAWLVHHEKRGLARRFEVGSVTTVRVDEDGLELTGRRGTRLLPYSDIRSLLRAETFVLLICRRRPRSEPLPASLLPAALVEYVEMRALGVRPVTTPEPHGDHVRRFVVPEGWARHLARVYAREVLRPPMVWLRFGLAELVVVALTIWVHPALGILVPLLLAGLLVGAYLPTLRNLTPRLPAGSVATTELFEDHFVSRNQGGAREFRYADVVSAQVRGDVVLLRTASAPPWLIARSLLPDDVLDRLTPGHR